MRKPSGRLKVEIDAPLTGRALLVALLVFALGLAVLGGALRERAELVADQNGSPKKQRREKDKREETSDAGVKENKRRDAVVPGTPLPFSTFKQCDGSPDEPSWCRDDD